MRLSDAMRFASVLGLLAALVAVPLVSSDESAAAAPPASRQRLVLNELHIDVIHVEYVDGALRLLTRAGEAPYDFYQSRDVLFQLKDIANGTRHPIPDDPAYAFLGDVGDPIWVAPEFEVESVLYAGWDTENILPGRLRGDTVDLSLVEVTGPGRVELFTTDPLGAINRMFSSTDPAFRTMAGLPVSLHSHFNWVFTALGRYELTFEVRATAADGTVLAPARATYTWYVGGVQASDVTPQPTGTTLAVSPQNPSVGDQVTLNATVTPPSATGWVEFFDGTASLGFAEVSAGQAALSTTALAGGSHSLTARYTPVYTNDSTPSTSPPVTLVVSGNGAPTTGPPTSSPPPTSPPSATTPPAASPSPTCVPEPVPSTSTTTGTAVVLDQGHVDYAARLTGDRLSSEIKDGTVAGRTTWRDPADVVFHLKPAGATTVPASGYEFLGPAGSRIWQIPHINNPSLLWLGWNTEEVEAAQLTGSLTWSLDKVEGPGELVIYTFQGFGQPRVVFNSRDGLPDRHTVPTGTHAHGNWVFTSEGAYEVTFTHQATLADGRSVSDTATVTFAIGNTDPNALARDTTGQTHAVAGDDCDGNLPITGASLVGLVPLGTGLVLIGGLVVLLTYRRRRASAAQA